MLGIFLDTETSGLDPFYHSVLEIALIIYDFSSKKELTSYESILQLPLPEWKKSDPESLKVNGFTWEETQKGKPKNQIEDEIIDLFKTYRTLRGEAVFICQNPSFDRPFFSQILDTPTQEKLNLPYHWLDLASMYWAKNPCKMPINKDAIAQSYGLPPESSPHKAMNGTRHLLACYEAVLKS